MKVVKITLLVFMGFVAIIAGVYYFAQIQARAFTGDSDRKISSFDSFRVADTSMGESLSQDKVKEVSTDEDKSSEPQRRDDGEEAVVKAEESTTDDSDWQTYKNDGYSIKYPPNTSISFGYAMVGIVGFVSRVDNCRFEFFYAPPSSDFDDLIRMYTNRGEFFGEQVISRNKQELNTLMHWYRETVKIGNTEDSTRFRKYVEIYDRDGLRAFIFHYRGEELEGKYASELRIFENSFKLLIDDSDGSP
ncbi:MAG: hypothetical protein Athens101428_348 [Candidatus Berkelbacteria bacterium Athens1014_28]|uniref:Uncharacterized protein n=1 Tax=Candidatus Berkelbacteria bacterium Athens1014_28 TaxID=2017145 RepID=A0A554LN40_9BACT|nr:MAG: hypothetical protein Athens101428_348 [Candidatus Berkelbacteria bacterium Athens1014_28]